MCSREEYIGHCYSGEALWQHYKCTVSETQNHNQWFRKILRKIMVCLSSSSDQGYISTWPPLTPDRLELNRNNHYSFLPEPGFVGVPKIGFWKHGAFGAAADRNQWFYSESHCQRRAEALSGQEQSCHENAQLSFKPQLGAWWMEPLGSFLWVLNELPREKIEGPPRDFLKASLRPYPRPDQRQKIWVAAGPAGFWPLVWLRMWPTVHL